MSKLNKKTGALEYSKVTTKGVIEAYYVAKFGDRKWMDDIISIHTGWMPWNWGTPPVSHVEGGVIVDGQLWFFSATTRPYLSTSGNPATGCRWMKAEELLRNPSRWKFKVCGSPVTSIKDRIARANSIVGLPYDKIGVIFDFISPIDFAVYKKSWYCSKAWHFMDTALTQRISPRRRWKVSTKYKYIVCPYSYVSFLMRDAATQLTKPKKKKRSKRKRSNGRMK